MIICFNSLKKSSSQNEIKIRTLAMELISFLLEKYKLFLFHNKDFIDLIKLNLIESLLKNCISTDHSLMTISFTIFLNLVP